MNKVVVVTDSTAYVPPELVRRHELVVAPLYVNWDGKTYHDGVDITLADFYARLKTSKTMPTTSQTTPDDFMKIFSPILSDGKAVLRIFISDKLSGTLDSAQQVKQPMPSR